jgi:hypothetical protein
VELDSIQEEAVEGQATDGPCRLQRLEPQGKPHVLRASCQISQSFILGVDRCSVWKAQVRVRVARKAAIGIP